MNWSEEKVNRLNKMQKSALFNTAYCVNTQIHFEKIPLEATKKGWHCSQCQPIKRKSLIEAIKDIFI